MIIAPSLPVLSISLTCMPSPFILCQIHLAIFDLLYPLLPLSCVVVCCTHDRCFGHASVYSVEENNTITERIMIAIYREMKRGCSHVLWKEIVPASHASFMVLFLLCYKPSDLGSCFPFVVRCPCMNSVFVPAKTEMIIIRSVIVLFSSTLYYLSYDHCSFPSGLVNLH
jgi:hypothetical protein